MRDSSSHPMGLSLSISICRASLSPMGRADLIWLHMLGEICSVAAQACSNPFACKLDEANPTIAVKSAMEAAGAVFVVHGKPEEIFPGVWLTGPVPRPNPERYYGAPESIVTDGGLVTDSIPEDMALLINTDKGFVIVAGCGHAGTINTVEYARRILGAEPAYAIVGGLHLFAAPDSALAWTATRLRAAHLGYLLGAHCTGIEAVFRIRELADLDRKRAVVAAIGSSFDASKGIDPLALAQ